VVEHIVATPQLARHSEHHHWAQQLNRLDLRRHFVSLTVEDRHTIEAFLKPASNKRLSR
jgi:hypothetical protein